MKEQDIYLLERTKDATSNIIGFYGTEERAIHALKRVVANLIDERLEAARLKSDESLLGVYISEGFLISRNRAEVDPSIAFDKIEDPEEFQVGVDAFPAVDPAGDAYAQAIKDEHHVAEDLGDVKDRQPLYGEDEVPLG